MRDQNHQKTNKMNKERYNQIVDEVYKNYLNETMFSSDPTWLEPIPVMDMKTGEKSMGARQYHKEAFLNKCKTNKEFSGKWGLKIEERELSLKERLNLVSTIIGEEKIRTHEDNLARVDKLNIPTKLIIVTYKDEIIEILKGGNK
jgi:hypothetical protein